MRNVSNAVKALPDSLAEGMTKVSDNMGRMSERLGQDIKQSILKVTSRGAGALYPHGENLFLFSISINVPRPVGFEVATWAVSTVSCLICSKPISSGQTVERHTG